MRNFVLLVVFIGSLLSAKAQGNQSEPAGNIMQSSYTQAALSGKKVLLMFHASWCVWCQRMDKSMQDPVCKKFFDNNFIITHLVVDEADNKKHLENPGAAELRKQFNGDGLGIPFWVILDAGGNKLADARMPKETAGSGDGDNCGCPATEKEVNYFISVLQRTTRLDQTALEIIRKRFRENDK